jgi:hypothetical protein
MMMKKATTLFAISSLLLEVGITPSGDFTVSHMADVIEYSTGQPTANDRTAIADYLM